MCLASPCPFMLLALTITVQPVHSINGLAYVSVFYPGVQALRAG